MQKKTRSLSQTYLCRATGETIACFRKNMTINIITIVIKTARERETKRTAADG